MILANAENKKEYAAPSAEFELFTITDVIATSGGQGQFDDDDPDEGAIDAYVYNEDGELEAFMDQYGNEVSPDAFDAIF